MTVPDWPSLAIRLQTSGYILRDQIKEVGPDFIEKEMIPRKHVE
jgi:hypothetical protein